MSNSILVIGGGIAGIQASLDLAEAGARVILVEKEATIGGKMAVLDKNFPTLDCSICIEAPKMSEVDLHPNIEILALSEVVGLEGEPGDFTAQIRQKTAFVTDECTRCDDCVAACPVVLPNEYDSGMAARKAIYTPIPQAVPGPYLIDIDNCLNNPPNYLPCDHCSTACLPNCIDFLLPREEMLTREVGSVVVAIGYDMLDPHEMREYGFGSHPDILTALEFERLVNSAGPTGGEIILPSNGEHPESILFVLCVGSRDKRFQQYCSRFCCMYSIKHAYQAMDHGVEDVTVLYMDVRAYGKGFDGFWDRTEENGARFVRGRPSKIAANGNGRIHVTYESTEEAKRKIDEYDMVVLANAVTPPESLTRLAASLGIETDTDGFLLATEEVGGLVTTTQPGIYAAGCATGPKDIPDSVAEGSGAAALALSHLTDRYEPFIPDVEPMEGIEEARVGVFVCHCGSNIAGVIDVEQVVEYSRTLPGVVFASHQMFSCAGNTQQEIEDAIRDERITRVVIAACSPKTHEKIFRGVMQRAGLNPYLLEMSNIRNMDSWVHKYDKEAATMKAMDMVWMSVEKARLLEPLESSELPLTQAALVVGGGIAGMTAAAAVARQGIKTHLVEKSDKLGGLLNELHDIAPAGLEPQDLIEAQAKLMKKARVKVHLETTVDEISGIVGNFEAQLSNGKKLKIGAVIMATGSTPYQPPEDGFLSNPRVITNLQLEKKLADGGLDDEVESVTFIGCVGSRNEEMGCSRYCCTSMIGQALKLRQSGKKVRVLFKDIRTYSRQAEELYEEAMTAGVQFFNYDSDHTPEEVITADGSFVEFYDHLIGSKVKIPSDLIVLAIALRPTESAAAEQLKLAKSEDGFLMELHPKLGPAETAVQGVYLAGTSQGAKDVRESMAQAMATAAKAGALLSKDFIEKEPLTAQVNMELCIACMRCVKVCPFGAIEQIGPVKEGTIIIHEAACMSCGNCTAECNFEAIDMPYFTKEADYGADRCRAGREARREDHGLSPATGVPTLGQIWLESRSGNIRHRPALYGPCAPRDWRRTSSRGPSRKVQGRCWLPAADSQTPVPTATTTTPMNKPGSVSNIGNVSTNARESIRIASSWNGSQPRRAKSSRPRSKRWTM